MKSREGEASKIVVNPLVSNLMIYWVDIYADAVYLCISDICMFSFASNHIYKFREGVLFDFSSATLPGIYPGVATGPCTCFLLHHPFMATIQVG